MFNQTTNISISSIDFVWNCQLRERINIGAKKSHWPEEFIVNNFEIVMPKILFKRLQKPYVFVSYDYTN